MFKSRNLKLRNCHNRNERNSSITYLRTSPVKKKNTIVNFKKKRKKRKQRKSLP